MKPGNPIRHLDRAASGSPADAAARWILRHDHGLTAAEQDDFSEWLAASAEHRAAWAEHHWAWQELDRLAGLQTSLLAVPDPNLLAPPRAGMIRFVQPLMAVAASLVLGLILWSVREPVSNIPETPSAALQLARIEQRELADGSVVALNRGTVVTEHYSAGERRVRLERGEAHFQVAKDPARPFFVEAGGVVVRAVGTAFNVRLAPASVEVLVTEGKVGVARVDPVLPEARAAASLTVAVGECVVVSRSPGAPLPPVAVVPPAEIEARLAWQPQLLDFTGAPLAEIIEEFNRRNPSRLRLGDPGLGRLRLSATFRSDNVEGFVRLLESDFGMQAERRGGGEIVLARGR